MSQSLAIIHDFTERDSWNAFIGASPIGHFFQSWEWGELQDGLGGRPRRIAAMSEGRVVGCVQVLVFDSTSRKFAYVPRGPVADPGDEHVVGPLLDAAVDVSARAGTDLVRMEPQWAFHADHAEWLKRRGFVLATQTIMPPRTLVVDLRPPLDEVWAGFRSNTRNRIRLAEKRGVEVWVGNADDVPAFVRLFEETSARHGLGLSQTEMFSRAARIFGPLDTMRLYFARAEGTDLAGLFVFLWGTTATYLWGASSSSEAARQLNPNQLLHWTAMRWARERGCTTYDLFGIPDFDAHVLETEYGRRSDGWWNLYRFKRGFGGRVHRHLGTFDYRFGASETSPRAD